MRILLTIAVLLTCSACTPEIRTYMSGAKQEIVSYSYGRTFKEFFLGNEISPSVKYEKEVYLKQQCENYNEKRVRYITGVNDEAWYDQCPPAQNITTGPTRIEMTARPPYTKLWTAQRVNNFSN
jgi:hypothetical protein